MRTIRIKGMMCAHCEAHVKAALEAVKGVKSAEVSHLTGTAIVDADPGVSEDALANAIIAAGYELE